MCTILCGNVFISCMFNGNVFNDNIFNGKNVRRLICSGSSLASNVFNVFMLVICPMGVRSAVMYAMQFSRNSLHPPQRIFNNTITSHLFRNPALYIQTFSSYPCARTDFRASVQCLPRSYIARNFHKINKENIVERSSFLLS